MFFELLIVFFCVLLAAIYVVIIKPYIFYKKIQNLYSSFQTSGCSCTLNDEPRSGQIWRHFDVSICNIHNQTVIELINPDLIKQFYQKSNENAYIKADIITSSFKMLVKHGIIMKEGQQWKQRKRIISSVFTHDFLMTLLPQIHKICQARFDQVQKKYRIESQDKSKQLFELNLHLVFQQIFSEVIVRLFFGSQPTETLDGKNICQFINDLMAGIIKELKSPLFAIFGEVVASGDLKKMLKSFKQLARKLINKRIIEIQSQEEKPSQPRDIIEALVLSGHFSHKQHTEQKNKDLLTYDDLIGQFCTFFVAGMDTTSNFMTSLVYHLAKQSSSEILEKMNSQIEKVFEEKEKNLLSFKDLKKMNYIQMVQKQGLRMFTPVTGLFFRKAVKSHFLGRIPIPVGTTVVARNRSNFFKEQYFHNPFVFDPQRWSHTNPNLHPYAFVPFSSGARTCIGNNLSLMQSKIVLAQLLRRYKKMTLQKQNYKMIAVFLYAPEKIKTTLEKRN